MPDFTDLIMKIRNSGLPEQKKAEIERRLIREGPGMDVDWAIEDALLHGKSTDSASTRNTPTSEGEPPPRVIYVERKPEKKQTPAEFLVGFIVFIAIGAFVYYWVFPIFHSTPTPVSSVPTYVLAEQMYSEYEKNEIAADQKYKNSFVMVRGKIESIGRDILKTAYVVLNGGGFFGVQCYFEESHSGRLTSLSPGQTVTIWGVVSGKFGNISVKRCEIM